MPQLCNLQRHPKSFKWNKRSTVLRLFTLVVSAIFVTHHAELAAAESTDRNAKAMAPIIMMLLEESGIPLIVGSTNPTPFSSENFPAGVEFSYRAVNRNLDVVITLSQIPVGQQVGLYLDGKLVSTLGNGSHTIALPVSSRSESSIAIRPIQAGGRFRVDSIQLLDGLGPKTRGQAQRFLTKATFGATEDEIGKLLSMGYRGWLDQQLSTNPTLNLPFFDQAVIDRKNGRNQLLIANGETNQSVLDSGLGLGNLCVTRMDAWWNSTMKGADQLRQRLAFALSQILVIGDTGCEGGPPRAFSIYYDILLKNAFGNYRNLLNDVTLNPMMGNYLSMRGSSANSAGPFLSPDENYAREVMQLFSIGLTELNIDGSEKKVNGQSVETYTNSEVHDLARALTGWQVATGRFFPGWEGFPMEPWGPDGGRFHDREKKTIVGGVEIPANLLIEEDLKRALDTVFNHDNVGPFISKQLIQRFVTSNPSRRYVERVAKIFNDNGRGERGDLKAVIKAILLDDESINSHLDSAGGKLKEPLLRVTQIWRAFDAQSPIRYIRYFHSDRDLGQRALAAPTVFNFYPPTFSPQGEIQDLNMVAPEFKLTGDGQNIRYYTRMAQIVQSKQFGDPNPIYSPSFNLPMNLNLDRAMEKADDLNSLLTYLDELLFGGLMSDNLRNLVRNYLQDMPEGDDLAQTRKSRVEEALLLLVVSPEFTVQR